MDDYIKRSEAIEALHKAHSPYPRRRFISVDAIKNVPAADVRPVVLCRDCTWFYDGSDMKCCTNHGGVVITDENGFCHHAKTKKGGADG